MDETKYRKRALDIWKEEAKQVPLFGSEAGRMKKWLTPLAILKNVFVKKRSSQ